MTSLRLKRGSVRPDGQIFRGYSGCYETWYDPAQFHKDCIGNTHRRAKTRASAKTIKFDIDIEYLLSIFPSDGLCPVFKLPMVWGGNADNSPSLDRKSPSLGYVRGNVAFISNKANRIKTDATTEEVLAVANYLKDHS